MGLDPTIALQGFGKPGGGTPAGGGNALNPISQLSDIVQLQTGMGNLRNQQQTWAARAKAGQIIAASPDTESAIKGLMADPLVAPFAHETINGLRTANQTLATTSNLQASGARDALTGYLKAASAAVADPSMLPQITEAMMATMPPDIAARAGPAIKALQTSLVAGLPADPAQASLLFRHRLIGQTASAGMTPEQLGMMIGTPAHQDVGGRMESGVQAPAHLGGGFVPGSATGKTLAPTVIQGPYGPGGAETPVILGGSAGAVAGPNALSPGLPALGAVPGPAPRPAIPALPVGPSLQEKTYGEASGKKVADMEEELGTNAGGIPEAMKRADVMLDALSNFQAGGGAEARAGFGKALQAIRNAGGDFIPAKLIEQVANGSLPDSQLFTAEVRPFVITQLKEAAQGTGRVMKSEVDAFLKSMDTTTDPRALLVMMNQLRQKLAIEYDKSQKWPEFREGVREKKPEYKGLTLPDFQSWYVKNYHPEGLPGTNAAGGLDLSPRPGAAVQGGSPTPGVPIRRWNPTTRKLELVP